MLVFHMKYVSQKEKKKSLSLNRKYKEKKMEQSKMNGVENPLVLYFV